MPVGMWKRQLYVISRETKESTTCFRSDRRVRKHVEDEPLNKRWASVGKTMLCRRLEWWKQGAGARYNVRREENRGWGNRLIYWAVWRCRRGENTIFRWNLFASQKNKIKVEWRNSVRIAFPWYTKIETCLAIAFLLLNTLLALVCCCFSLVWKCVR